MAKDISKDIDEMLVNGCSLDDEALQSRINSIRLEDIAAAAGLATSDLDYQLVGNYELEANHENLLKQELDPVMMSLMMKPLKICRLKGNFLKISILHCPRFFQVFRLHSGNIRNLTGPTNQLQWNECSSKQFKRDFVIQNEETTFQSQIYSSRQTAGSLHFSLMLIS